MAVTLKDERGEIFETNAMFRRRMEIERQKREKSRELDVFGNPLPLSDVITKNSLLLDAWIKGRDGYGSERVMTYDKFADLMECICCEFDKKLEKALANKN